MSKLTALRVERGMDMSELAYRSGLSKQGVRYLEQKRRFQRGPQKALPVAYPIPTLPNARMIARALGVSVNAIWPVAEEEK